MDSTGAFHVVEKNGNLFLVYHHPKYDPIPQTQSLTSSGEAASSDDHFLHPFFFCPEARWRKDSPYLTFPVTSSPEYVFSTRNGTPSYHYVLPLFWCNNKEFDANGGCDICQGSNFGTNYYFCDYCDRIYHKECVQSPPKIKHPYHPDHSLQLNFQFYKAHNNDCISCGRSVEKQNYVSLVYSCTICEVFLHPICAMKMIPFTVNHPKRHDHSLSFFPRQASLICNVCGLLRETYPTYICVRCNFVAHNDCMYSPRIIEISRHNHRISYISYLPSKEWFCGVCRKSININYGAYTCDKCSDYAVHLRCALGKDVWDGKDLEDDVLEEDEITQDVEPFDVISKGVILYFLHDHHLQLEVSILYDESKLCEACALPIYEGNFYSCKKYCDFVLHEKCANAPRKIQHALHPHPLTLKHVSGYDNGYCICSACYRYCCGFVYECHIGECQFDLDVRCALISEPFDYQGHRHPLFLALDPKQKPICLVCKEECHKQLNCIECNFIVCFKCATLPDKARYKHDKHFLRILWWEEVCEKDWCEVCERDLGNTEVFYCCDECCTTFHIECLFGEDPYMKPGQCFKSYNEEVQILRKSNISRPLCDRCKNFCQGKIFKSGNLTACSLKCVRRLLY